ncbi:MAG: hypothetical protein K1Y36_00190 [Blastocatellia bacterium]|nr:hypothetical protein [Blastocatellia bacterium]
MLPESVAGNTLKFVVEQAATALSQRKLQDREECLGHMQLFQRFHMFSTAIHRFFQELVKESAEFRFNYEYGDEPRQFWARYTLTFGTDQYQRNFPIVVTYQRFPSYSTTLKIDVSEIGDSVSGRTRQTDRLTHGRIEHHYSGLFYWAVAPESVQDVPLTLRWLKRTFIEIFKLTYET